MQLGSAKPVEQAPGGTRLETLLAGIAQGDREALAELYGAVRGAVYATALGILRSVPDAQDVTQDVFVRIWDSAGGYRPQGTPMAWILTIARNMALMRLRGSGRTEPMDEAAWSALSAPGLTPEDRTALRAALERLADEERQIVLLHAAAGLKHREISQLLQIPLATVLSKYHRALKKLRTHMEGDDAS